MRPLSRSSLLAKLPYEPPMRFVTDILEVDADHIVGCYEWTEEDCAGHFRDNLIVPGVKILECAAQTGCVAWGLYHLSCSVAPEEIAEYVGLFTSVERAVFKRTVRPGQVVRVEGTFGEDGYFRSNKILCEVVVRCEGGPADGEEVFRGVLAGMWMPRVQVDSPEGGLA